MPPLSHLSLLLSPAVVYGEVNPSSYEILEGITWDSGSTSQFFDILDSSLQKLATSYDVIAIAYSGGVDSAYCLYKLHQLRGSDSLIPIYFDARTDNCSNYSTTVLDTLAMIAPGCRLEVVREGLHEVWNPAGPSLHAVPSAAAALEQRAYDLHAQVLITGCGADEIVTPPKYLGLAFLANFDISKAIARATQALSVGYGAIAEEFLAPALVPFMSSEQQFLFVAEEMHFMPPYEWLQEPYKTECRSWTESLYGLIRQKCLSQATTLAQMDAFLSVFPQSRLSRLTNCDVDVRHPFQDPEVVRAGLQVSFAEKLGSVREPVYKRRKSLLYSRMPTAFRRCVPDEKVGYSTYFEETVRYDDKAHGLLQEIGLLGSNVSLESLDLSTKLILASITRWIEGARRRDYPLHSLQEN